MPLISNSGGAIVEELKFANRKVSFTGRHSCGTWHNMSQCVKSSKSYATLHVTRMAAKKTAGAI